LPCNSHSKENNNLKYKKEKPKKRRRIDRILMDI